MWASDSRRHRLVRLGPLGITWIRRFFAEVSPSTIEHELGFDPVDAGPVADSWRQQPGTPAYTQDIDAPKLRAALAAADPARVAACRKAANDQVLAYFAQQQQQQ